VLCEKPACSNLAELETILDAAAKSGCAFLEAMRSLKTPNFDIAKAALQELGAVRHFTATFCQLSSRWPAYLRGENPNAFLPTLSNGALMDLGCYAIYSAVALLGPPTKTSYTALMLPTGVDGGGTVVLQYPDSIATLTISKMSHSWNHSELQTENGTLIIDNLGEWSQLHSQKKGGERVNLGVTQEKNNLMYEIAAFVKMVQDGKTQDTTLTWELSRQVMTVLDAARKDAGIVYPADIM